MGVQKFSRFLHEKYGDGPCRETLRAGTRVLIEAHLMHFLQGFCKALTTCPMSSNKRMLSCRLTLKRPTHDLQSLSKKGRLRGKRQKS